MSNVAETLVLDGVDGAVAILQETLERKLFTDVEQLELLKDLAPVFAKWQHRLVVPLELPSQRPPEVVASKMERLDREFEGYVQNRVNSYCDNLAASFKQKYPEKAQEIESQFQPLKETALDKFGDWRPATEPMFKAAKVLQTFEDSERPKRQKAIAESFPTCDYGARVKTLVDEVNTLPMETLLERVGISIDGLFED